MISIGLVSEVEAPLHDAILTMLVEQRIAEGGVHYLGGERRLEEQAPLDCAHTVIYGTTCLLCCHSRSSDCFSVLGGDSSNLPRVLNHSMMMNQGIFDVAASYTP